MSISGKVVLVTGVTSGIGRAIAEVWTARGAKVVGCGRRLDLGSDLEKSITSNGGEFSFVAADVRRSADCANAVTHTVDVYGRIDVLVNNAGIEGEVTDFHSLTDEQWDEVIEINLRGTVLCAREAVRHMLTQGNGTLLHVASINAVVALAHMAPYNASKAAVVQFSRTLAVEYAGRGIRSNSILLGGADGDTSWRTQDKFAQIMRGPSYVRPDDSTARYANKMVRPAPDVAAFLALLADDDAELLTGATIAVDGAATAGLPASMMFHMMTAGLWDISEIPLA